MNPSAASAKSPPTLNGDLVREAIRRAPPQERMTWMAAQLGLSDADLLPKAARHFGLQVFNMKSLRQVEPDLALLSYADCQRRGCLIGRLPDEDALIVVLTDPTDTRLRQWLEVHLGQRPVRLTLATAADLQATLVVVERTVRAMDALPSQRESAGGDNNVLSISMSQIDATSSPVVKLVDSTLHDALRAGASDIHMETQPNGMVIKYRLDGVLEVVKKIDNVELAHQAISRIKVVSELDIAERRVPQDGRFKVVADGRDIDFRVSIMPNLYGEDAVLRVLDRKHLTGQFKAAYAGHAGLQARGHAGASSGRRRKCPTACCS